MSAPLKFGVRRVGDVPSALSVTVPFGAVGDRGDGQRVAVHVGVVAQHVDGVEPPCPRWSVAGVVHRHRRVVDRVDGDRHRAGVGQPVPSLTV